MTNHVTLLVPGLRLAAQLASELRQLPSNQIPHLPSLDRFLALSKTITGKEVIDNDFLFEHLASEYSKAWPQALWRLHGESSTIEAVKTLLCADPVYIHPDRDEALLYAHEEINLNEDEAIELVALINAHYQDESWTLHMASPHRWYIRTEDEHEVYAASIHEVKGKNIFEFLPRGEHGRYWQQCLNEIQMLLHSCDINQQREQDGLLPVNSLWFWGAGKPVNLLINQDRVFSNDPVVKGMAVALGKQVDSLPVNIKEILTMGSDLLVYYDVLQKSLRAEDYAGWLSALEEFDINWLKPLIEHLSNNKDCIVNLAVSEKEAYQLDYKRLTSWLRGLLSKNKTGIPF